MSKHVSSIIGLHVSLHRRLNSSNTHAYTPLSPLPSIALYILLLQLLYLTSSRPAYTLVCSSDFCSFLVLTLNSYRFFEIISSPLIGRYNNFAHGHAHGMIFVSQAKLLINSCMFPLNIQTGLNPENAIPLYFYYWDSLYFYLLGFFCHVNVQTQVIQCLNQ